MNNKKIGNELEQKIAMFLGKHGYWVTLLSQDTAGQPADMIAVNREDTLLIDAKHCSDNIFRFSRVEPNQVRSMRMFNDKTNGWCGFAIAMEDKIYMLPYRRIEKMESEGRKSINKKFADENLFTLQEYVGAENESID